MKYKFDVNFKFALVPCHVSGTITIEDLAPSWAKQLLSQGEKLMIDTSAILAAVAEENTELKSWKALVDGLTTTITKLSQDLAAAIANSDPAALAQVQADLDKAAQELSADNTEAQAAIAANTQA